MSPPLHGVGIREVEHSRHVLVVELLACIAWLSLCRGLLRVGSESHALKVGAEQLSLDSVNEARQRQAFILHLADSFKCFFIIVVVCVPFLVESLHFDAEFLELPLRRRNLFWIELQQPHVLACRKE